MKNTENGNTGEDDFENGTEAKTGYDPFSDEDGFFGESEDGAGAPPTGETEKPAAKKRKQTGGTLGDAIEDMEAGNAERALEKLREKPPVFTFGDATETIADTSQTFDELRIAKCDDFPELEDGKRVSWTVEYLKTTREVADPKGTSIEKVKSEIENSKEFTASLKKSKDREPQCRVRPRVRAQTKGGARKPTAAYKGVFPHLDAAAASGKTIAIVPSRDGGVYEVRDTEMGLFATPTAGDPSLDDIRPGFVRKLPPIPQELLLRAISFLRHHAIGGGGGEALVNVYWDRETEGYAMDAPIQETSRTSVSAIPGAEYECQRYIHYMDIHSHGTMRAFFSPADDRDEKATRLYTVMGRLRDPLPEIRTRISNGGKYLEIDPADVFEHIGCGFPEEWNLRVAPAKTGNGAGNENPHGQHKDATEDGREGRRKGASRWKTGTGTQ